jgi:hypothetical protein
MIITREGVGRSDDLVIGQAPDLGEEQQRPSLTMY